MQISTGMGEIHDGVNFMRAACVIAIEKAQISFEPLLEVPIVGCYVVEITSYHTYLLS